MIPNRSLIIKGVTHAHLEPIWYHLGHSDIPYSPNQFLGLDFFCHFLQQDSSIQRELILVLFALSYNSLPVQCDRNSTAELFSPLFSYDIIVLVKRFVCFNEQILPKISNDSN